MNPNKSVRLSSESPPLTLPPPTQEQITVLAHAIWMDRGCPVGCELDHWLEAERQLGETVRRRPAAPEGVAGHALDPQRSIAARVERSLERVVSPPGQRSPTSL